MARNNAHPPTSLNNEGEGRDYRKSEAPIVAMNAGNAAGAKGRQFEIVNRGHMPRHRADYAHEHTTYSLHTMGKRSPSAVFVCIKKGVFYELCSPCWFTVIFYLRSFCIMGFEFCAFRLRTVDGVC